jgi:hypothetical protein
MKDLRPLLEAQKRRPEGGGVSVIYLLPPLARDKLFSSRLSTADSLSQDALSHWSSLNFFSDSPDSRMTDSNFATKFIEDNYYEIAKPGRIGDLVLLLDPKNRVLHSSVYIADDVVFTKNNANNSQPWILMHEKDLLGTFSATTPVRVAYFRKKDF